MLRVVKNVGLKRATNSEHGNIQTFLERLLVEVIAGNYRYFLHEHLVQSLTMDEEPEAYCWPPLLANERQVSGLFVAALASVCPVSRPEFAIRRAKASEGKDASRSGRVDFYATYGNRSIALELKQKAISTKGDVSGKNGLAHQWSTVSAQATEALKHFRTDPKAYPHPIAIGLLVIRVGIKVTSGKTPEQARKVAGEKMPVLTEEVAKGIKPDFLACYTPPTEMQTFLRGEQWREARVFPGLIFAAFIPSNLPS